MYYFFTQTCFEVPDYRELHKSLNIPLTVIWGKHDEILVWKDIEEEVRKNFPIGESDIHILDAKHFIQEEEPERIVEIISGL
jgi:haloalkane dehalogenase